MPKKEENQAGFKDVISIYLKHVMKYKWHVFIATLLSSLSISANSLTPMIIGELFDILESTSVSNRSWNIFLNVILLFIALRVVVPITWRVGDYFNVRFQAKVMNDLENLAFTNILKHSYSFFTDTFSGSLVKKVGRFVRAFEKMADEITFRFWPVIVIILFTGFNFYFSHPSLLIVLLTWLIFYFIFSYFAAIYVVKLDIETNRLESKLGGSLSDMISNIVNIKLFSGEQEAQGLYKSISTKRSNALTKAWDGRDNIYLIQIISTSILEITLIVVSLDLWLKGILSLGDIAKVQSYIILLLGNIYGISRSIKHFMDAYADGKEMVDIIKTPIEVTDSPNADILNVTIGEIKFNQVTFGFSNEKILNQFNLEIAPKEKIALVGPSGAGKSTIVKLLLRYFDVKSGAITIDGQNIKNVTQHSLHRSISVVPQESILFHRSLMENIRYSQPSATDEQVIEAAKKAYCHDFIEKLPKGYNTLVGERGIKLSGGERQRVALARAILMNAPILIMDEATSALDSESEMLIQRALDEVMRNKTVITIAHRLSTVMKMDRIIVIDNGKIIEQGSHNELLKNRGSYKKLWNIQVDSFKD